MRPSTIHANARALAICLLAATCAPAPASAAGTTPAPALVAVLPLGAAQSDVPYTVSPTPSELRAMTAQLRAGRRTGGNTLLPLANVAAAVAAAGFVQANPDRACVVAECARAIGRSLHADRVVFGAVHRQMAVVWSTDVAAVDVKTGRVLGALSLGYKGDVLSMVAGERRAGSCLMRLVEKQHPCPPDHGW